jgi:hypothetical protein
MEALLFSIINFAFSHLFLINLHFFMFPNFLGDRLCLIGAPNYWGRLVVELTLSNERHATACSVSLFVLFTNSPKLHNIN